MAIVNQPITLDAVEIIYSLKKTRVVDADCLLRDSSETYDGKEVRLEIEKVIKSCFERGEASRPST